MQIYLINLFDVNLPCLQANFKNRFVTAMFNLEGEMLTNISAVYLLPWSAFLMIYVNGIFQNESF
jgi:hypothetical protein